MAVAAEQNDVTFGNGVARYALSTSVSPGQIVGSMLQPVTCKRSFPDERNTSPASSHLTACELPAIAARLHDALG